jgi:hypothetical protein
MTLQIGLVGRDGILLASDRCRIAIQNGVRTTSQISKYILSGKHVFTFAGDDVAQEIAEQTVKALDANPFEDPGKAGQRIFNFLGRPVPNPGAVLGIAQGQLWHLSFSGSGYSATPISDKIVAGDALNAAVFFSERHYFDLQNSIDGLKKLAAHMICMGGKLNPAGVQGLEIIVWDRARDTIGRVDDHEIQALSDLSEKLDADIGRAFAE